MSLKKILIIIKDDKIRNDIETSFSNYAVDAVSDFQEGIELYKKYRYCIVITDMNVGNYSSIDKIKKIKEINKDIAIIIISEENDYKDTIAALQYGALKFFNKPVKVEKLKDTVKEIFKMKSILEKTRKIDYYLCSTKKTYLIPNDINLISDLAATLSRDLIISDMCSEADILNIDLSLVEMLTNSVEHGNLEISGDEKASLIEKSPDEYIHELESRSKQNPYSERMVKVETSIDHEKVIFIITDEGPGFDYSKIKRKINKSDLLKINGRGIVMTLAAMDELIYEGKGNKVTMIKYFRQRENLTA